MVISRRARANERGAAVLIVMLAITMLTAVGVFAANRAAMVTSASGYDRQANQTRYLAEYAGNVAASELGENRAGEYLRLAMDPSSSESCDANAHSARAIAGRLPCYVMEPDDLKASVAAQIPGTSLLEESSATRSGSLSGPGAVSSVEGVMRVELFDARAIMHLAGEDERGDNPFRPVEVVASAWAQVRAVSQSADTDPESAEETAPTAWANDRALTSHASVQALRAHIRVPSVSVSLLRSVPASSTEPATP